ncbi:MAG: right-handed parallel beta-helix repeat-containing protein [Phycisphaerae bacterium]|nr:right-handed parallel beta-helix repeat-containing protein [Phycisphaerae bacterium]
MKRNVIGSRKREFVLSMATVWAVLAFFMLPDMAYSAVRLVPGEFATIQGAIDASVDGDEVVLAAGVYRGVGQCDLHFNGKGITVRSTNPNDLDVMAATVIDCEGEASSPVRGVIFDGGEEADSVLEGLTIANGYANSGAGIYCQGSSPTIRKCIIRANTTTGSGGGLFCDQGSSPTISQCFIMDNLAIDFDGGGIACLGSNPIIVGCFIKDNVANRSGGGIFCDSESEPWIGSSLIVQNRTVSYVGGGLYCKDSSPFVVNSLISGNHSASHGGGVYSSGVDSLLVMINSTVTGNRCEGHGGGLSSFNGPVEIYNSIVWGNVVYGEGQYAQLALTGGAAVEHYVSDSDIEGVLGQVPSEGDMAVFVESPALLYSQGYVIDADPLFVAPGAWEGQGTVDDPADDTWALGDYELSLGSPCRNGGNSLSIEGIVSVDIKGDSRIIGSAVDMGAYEMTVPDGPDLVGAFTQVKLPTVLVPGDKGSVAVTVDNMGNLDAEGKIGVNFYLSTNQNVDGSDFLIGQATNQKIKLIVEGDNPKYKPKTVKGKLTIPSDIPAGRYYLLAYIDEDNNVIEESDDSQTSNVVVAGPYDLYWRFGEFPGRTNVKLTVLDPEAVPVRFMVSGGGWGEIIGGSGFHEVNMHETTEKSSLVISAKGRDIATSVGDINVAAGSLKMINARMIDLRGDITVEGTLFKLIMKDVLGDIPGGHLIDISGVSASSKEALMVMFNSVKDLSISSPSFPVKSIMAAEWLDGDGFSDGIVTPWVGKLLVKGHSKTGLAGDFQADMILSGQGAKNDLALASASIVGAVDGVRWEVSGHVGSLTVGALTDSDVLVGCNEGLDAFTGTLDDHSGEYLLSALTLRGRDGMVFEDSRVAAWAIGRWGMPKDSAGTGQVQYVRESKTPLVVPAGVTDLGPIVPE